MKPMMAATVFLMLASAAWGQSQRANLLGEGPAAMAQWKFFIHADYRAAGAVCKAEPTQLSVTIPSAESRGKELIHAIQAYKPVELEANKTYQLTFTTTSDVAGKISVNYILSAAPYPVYATAAVELKKEAGQKHVVKFTPKPVSDKYESPRSIRFYLGALPAGTLAITDLVLEEAKP